jgi:hypothetical protein
MYLLFPAPAKMTFNVKSRSSIGEREGELHQIDLHFRIIVKNLNRMDKSETGADTECGSNPPSGRKLSNGRLIARRLDGLIISSRVPVRPVYPYRLAR